MNNNTGLTLISAVLIVLLAAGCVANQPPAANATQPAPAPVPVLQVMVYDQPTYGNILTDADGMTLYVFTVDSTGVSNCNTAACLALWPPLISSTVPDVSDAPGSFSRITRSDGRQQLAYNGMPLYTFANDAKPGDVNGEGYAGKWFVAQINLTTFPSPLSATPPAQNTTPAVPAPAAPNATNATPPAANTPQSAVKVSNDPAYGSILTDADGMTLYVLSQDSNYSSTCTGECAQTWPPLITDRIPSVAGAPGTFGLLGDKQVAYNGMPLYRYAYDSKPGDALGNGINGVWHVAATNLTTFPPLPAAPKPAYGGGY